MDSSITSLRLFFVIQNGCKYWDRMLPSNGARVIIMSEPSVNQQGGMKKAKIERAIRRNFNGVNIASEPTVNQSGWLAIFSPF